MEILLMVGIWYEEYEAEFYCTAEAKYVAVGTIRYEVVWAP